MDNPSDPAVKALDEGDIKTAYQTILFKEKGTEIASLFYQESKLSASDPVLESRLIQVGSAFDKRLYLEMNSSTFQNYRRLSADSGLREKSRMRLIRPMIEGAHRLRAGQRDTLKAFIEELLESAVSSKMKADLLLQTARPDFGLAFPALLSWCRSPDSLARRAAYKALIQGIARNRDAGRAVANQVVFDSLAGPGAPPPDRYRVLALAALGQDQAREYLLATCGSDAIKLEAILKQDPYLKHPGLVRAALAFPRESPEGKTLRAALRYGLKESAWVADQLASGASADPAKADELRTLMHFSTSVSP
jgi:hypothetical protein